MNSESLDSLVTNKLCTDLIIRFASLLDKGAFEELSQLFCEDAVFARPSQPDVFIEGRSNILETFLARPPRLTRHIVSNVSVTAINATRCEAVSTVCLYTAQPDSNVATPPFLIGSYNDVLVSEEGRWLFKVRQGHIDLRVEA